MATPARTPQPEAPPELRADTTPQTVGSHRHPSPEEIAREAYLIYLANGAQDGRDQDDWYEAETRLLGDASPRQASANTQQAAAQLDAVDTRDRTPG